MECQTNPKKKFRYQAGLWGLFLGNLLPFAAGCVSMVLGFIPESVRGFMAIVLVVLVVCFLPTFLLLVRGLGLSGTQRVFLTDGTLLYMSWDADRGEGGARHRFCRIFKVTDYQVKRNSIDIKAYVWYAEKIMARDSLPVTDGQLGDISDILADAERCQREFSICRTLDHEEEILAMLESRRQTAAQL